MWTILFFLSLTLAGFVYLVDHYSKGRRRKANSLLYVHPSNALIEQALPMVNLNPKIFAELNKSSISTIRNIMNWRIILHIES
jgi:hypothetical protein